MDYYRKIERSVTISADKRSTVDLQVDIWSQDLNVTKFVLKLDTADSTPIDLTNAAVRVAIVYNQDGQDVKIEAAGIVEDVATQKIAYVMSDKLAGFEGEVTAGFYVTLKTGQRIDIQNVTFNMCKSLLDKDLEAATENYYQTFDDIAKDVRNQADTQKSAMLAKTNEVTSYGDTQKTAMNNIVKDVQSTGNTAKTQIGQVLPDVQSKVTAINTELAKIDANMPDLFVAYANNSTGGGFSRTDTTKLYKGFGVKNSNSPTDYRWERNVDNLSVGGTNLLLDSDFRNKFLNITANTSYVPGHWIQYNNHSSYEFGEYNDKTNYLQFTSTSKVSLGIIQFLDRVVLQPGKEYFIRLFTMCETSDYRIGIKINKKSSNGSIDWNYSFIFDKTVKASSNYSEISAKFTIPAEDDGVMYGISIYNYGTDTSNGQTIKMVKPKLEEGNTPTAWSLALEDLILNSNPVNSILTTLSAENPSTTLGGSWTQLGTETKFGQTIYYWKRTN